MSLNFGVCVWGWGGGGGDVSTRSFSTKKRFVQKLRELNKDKHNMYKILNDCLDYFHNTLIF